MVRAAKSGLLKQFAFDLETTGGFIDFNEGVKPNGARFIPISESTYINKSGVRWLTNVVLSFNTQRGGGRSKGPSMASEWTAVLSSIPEQS